MPNEEETANVTICEWCNQSTPNSLISENEFWNLSNVCITCNDNDFRYSERCDVWVANEDWNDEEHNYQDEDYDEDYDDEERDEYVLNYSRRVSSKIYRMKYEKPSCDELTLGIELEVQVRESSDLSRNDIAYNLQHKVLTDFVICKEDASIGYGFEIVSSPATFDYHKHKWNDFFNSEEINYLKSFRDNTTGLHIHIGQNFLSRLAVGKMLYFINSEQNRKFLDLVSGRKETNYCHRNSSLKIKDVKTYRDRGALNIFVHHSPTHEFRLFNGNIKKASFFRCLEFVVALSNFVKNECSTINPNYIDFISYVRINHFHYPYLTNWLLDKKYLKNIKHKTMFYDKKKARKVCV